MPRDDLAGSEKGCRTGSESTRSETVFLFGNTFKGSVNGLGSAHTKFAAPNAKAGRGSWYWYRTGVPDILSGMRSSNAARFTNAARLASLEV